MKTTREVFQHFGHTPEFLVCEVADGKIASSETVSSGATRQAWTQREIQ